MKFRWLNWYKKYAKYYHILDGYSINFKLKKFRDKWDLKIYDKEELEKILEKHNFKILKLFGSIFGDEVFKEFSEESECIVVFAKKLS